MIISYNLSRVDQNNIQSMEFSESPTQSLIDGLKQGDRQSQSIFYKQYFGKMLGIAMRYSSDKEEAHSILNLAFYKVFKSIFSYKNTGKFDAWVAVIVKRTALDQCKKVKYYHEEIDGTQNHDRGIINEGLNNLLVEEIYALIQGLPPASRNVFSLHVLEGYKHDEISKMLNISTGTSKWHVSNARKLLQEALIKR